MYMPGLLKPMMMMMMMMAINSMCTQYSIDGVRSLSFIIDSYRYYKNSFGFSSAYSSSLRHHHATRQRMLSLLSSQVVTGRTRQNSHSHKHMDVSGAPVWFFALRLHTAG